MGPPARPAGASSGQGERPADGGGGDADVAQELAGSSLGDTMQEATFGVLYTLSKEKFSEGWRWVATTMVRGGALAAEGWAEGGRRLARAAARCTPTQSAKPRPLFPPLSNRQVIDYLQIAVFFIGNK